MSFQTQRAEVEGQGHICHFTANNLWNVMDQELLRHWHSSFCFCNSKAVSVFYRPLYSNIICKQRPNPWQVSWPYFEVRFKLSWLNGLNYVLFLPYLFLDCFTPLLKDQRMVKRSNCSKCYNNIQKSYIHLLMGHTSVISHIYLALMILLNSV